jgi:hypothetical protein
LAATPAAIIAGWPTTADKHLFAIALETKLQERIELALGKSCHDSLLLGGTPFDLSFVYTERYNAPAD